jgi:hypothetical protein
MFIIIGSYSPCDRDYTSWLRDFIRHHLGNEVVLFSTDGDGDGYLQCGKIPVWGFIYLFIYFLFIYLFIYLFIFYLFIYLFIYLGGLRYCRFWRRYIIHSNTFLKQFKSILLLFVLRLQRPRLF